MMSMSMNSEYLCVLEEQFDVTRLGIGTCWPSKLSLISTGGCSYDLLELLHKGSIRSRRLDCPRLSASTKVLPPIRPAQLNRRKFPLMNLMVSNRHRQL